MSSEQAISVRLEKLEREVASKTDEIKILQEHRQRLEDKFLSLQNDNLKLRKEVEDLSKRTNALESRQGQATNSSHPNTVKQWVTKVLAFSSQYNNEGYCADQIIGEPKVFPCHGDFQGAWASYHFSTPQFIEVGFETTVRLSSIHIYETFNPGSIVKVMGKESSSPWTLLWQTNHPVNNTSVSRIFSPELMEHVKMMKINQVRIELDMSAIMNWSELDAVQLVGEGRRILQVTVQIYQDIKMNLFGICFCVLLMTFHLVNSQCSDTACTEEFFKKGNDSCKSVPAVKSCYVNLLASCEDDLTYLKEMLALVEAQEETCNKSQANSQCQFLKCSNDFAKHFLSGGTVADACKHASQINSCFKTTSTTCPAIPKATLQKTIASFEKLNEACNNGQGLKSNIGGLLIVAMMVVVRHFL